MSLQASSVVELLVAECEQLGVEIRCEVEVEQVKRVGNRYEIGHHEGVEVTLERLYPLWLLSTPNRWT